MSNAVTTNNVIDLSTIDRTKLGDSVANALIALAASISTQPVNTGGGTGTTGGGTSSGGGTTTPPPPPPTGGIAMSGLFPLDTSYSYQLNSPGDANILTQGLIELFDKDLADSPHWGYGKAIPGDQFYFDLLPITQTGLTVNKVMLYSNTGSTNSGGTLWNLYAWNNGTLTLLAAFAAGVYNGWITYTIPNVLAQRLYISTTTGISPTEMQIYGTWVTKTPVLYPAKTISFTNMLGANGFVWDLLDPNTQQVVAKLQAGITSFSCFRLYQDYGLMQSAQGKYTFSPCFSGSWDMDKFLSTLKSLGISCLFDLHNQPAWMQATYPSGQANAENTPVVWSGSAQANTSLPASYIDQAKMGFQLAGRYGSNSALDISLLTVDPTTRWQGDTPNVVKKALGTLTYLECDNERDKWWKGTNAYQTGYQYAANLSAFYDGHKNTMGAAVGVKNADPNMQVVIGGTASPVPDYFRAIIDWSADNRGLNTDGSVNLPFDVINFHCYCGATQSGGSIACPEIYGMDKVIAPIVQVGLQVGKEVWITETGFDEAVGSPVTPPVIGSKSIVLVKADWTLRTALICARSGINRVFFYMCDDVVAGNPTQFATSGLIDSAQSDGRRPAARYLAQAGAILKGYNYSSHTILPSGAMQDSYVNGTAKINVVWMPTQVGATSTLTLGISTRVYTLSVVAGASYTTLTNQTTAAISETPVFIQISN